MNSTSKVILITIAIAVVVLMFAGCSIGYTNREKQLRNHISAKQKDNTSEYDNMWKKISQVGQVAEKDRESLKDIFNSHASARNTGGANDGSLMKWITESVPNVDSSVMRSLVNTITASRDSWTRRQKEILDLKREHDNLLDMFPSGMFISMFGNNQKIEVQIVTSERTGEAFRTGSDDDVEVFKK